MSAENEWKAALIRIHPTGRGTPDEMATDILEGMEAMRNLIADIHDEQAESAEQTPNEINK